MRVVAGTLRGLRIGGCRAPGFRPTSERVREALFSILGPGVAGQPFLDLFAGSGAVGIEALSRGASRAVFVESDAQALDALRENLLRAAQEHVAEVLPLDALRALRLLGGRGESFPHVFADPPYAYRGAPRLLRAIAQAGVLGSEGTFVLEHSVRGPVEPPKGLSLFRRERYGETALSFLRPACATA